jgi:hypothetical protein
MLFGSPSAYVGWILLISLIVLVVSFGIRRLRRKRPIDEAEVERHQRVLDQYLEREMDDEEIGRFYERQIGYLLESAGYDVTFHGALKGFNDLGIDLIAHKNKETLIIQTKCWSKSKLIDEKLIVKLFASTFHFKRRNLNNKNAKPVFYSTTGLNDLAEEVAKLLSVEIRDTKLDKSYPMIKCNVSRTNERIFHLPVDEHYDHVKIKSENNEF